MERSLQEFRVRGVHTNIQFLTNLITHPEFLRGEFTTRFLDGTVQNISRPVGAWIGTWDGNPHNHQVRWPYVFVSAYEDGLQVFNLKDPKNPVTEGRYFTCECEHQHGFGGTPDNGWKSTTSVEQGAFGVDIRNSDGLVVLSDQTGQAA
jgi:hypothetical protein